MGQVEDMFEMSSQEAANILRNIVLGYGLKIQRGSGKTLTELRCVQAMTKAIDILEKTPDEKKKKNQDLFYIGYKLCPDCDGKDFHPVKEFDGVFHPPYKCPKCGKIWFDYEDE